MRGKKVIPDTIFIELNKTMKPKEIANKLNLPLTTVQSRLDTLGLLVRKKNHIDLTEDNINFIKTHTAYQSSQYFRCYIGYIRWLADRNGIEYIRTREEPAYVKEKRLKRRAEMIKMHKTMSYSDIAKYFGISESRVSNIIKYGN